MGFQRSVRCVVERWSGELKEKKLIVAHQLMFVSVKKLTANYATDRMYYVLQSFQPFLKSIDVRTIAVRPQIGADFENLITSIMVSEKTVEEVKEEQNKLPKINNNQITLFTYAGVFELHIFEDFVNGTLGFNRISVPGNGSTAFGSLRIKTRKFNPLSLRMRSEQIIDQGLMKYVLRATDAGTQPEREQIWKVVQNQENEIKLLNYSSIPDLIKSVLRVDYHSQDRIDFVLTISDLAKIKNVVFDKNYFDVEITAISGLKSLQLNLIQKRAKMNRSYDSIWRTIVMVDKLEKHPSGRNYEMKTTLRPKNLLPYDLIELKLVHKESALTLDEREETAPLQNVTESLLNSLGHFCSIDDFKEMLFEPQLSGDPKTVFEIATLWLLSLSGFYTIYLGAKVKTTKKGRMVSVDVLRTEKGYEIGCADILAYEENKRLLVVDCDVGPFDSKKIEKLIETCDFLRKRSINERFEVVPVLFSPRSFDDEAHKQHVAIADHSVIEGILREIAKGDRHSARSQIYVFY